jgi:hypothetical protein
MTKSLASTLKNMMVSTQSLERLKKKKKKKKKSQKARVFILFLCIELFCGCRLRTFPCS